MIYVGSKGRHARKIMPIILKDRRDGQAYVEPFVGGCNSIQHVNGRRIGGDLHGPLISMWKDVAAGWLPNGWESLSEDEYKKAREAVKSTEPTTLQTFMGFALSYGGKWFGGYARSSRKDGSRRNNADEVFRSAQKQFPLIEGVEFHCASYDALEIPPNSLIYCDPPYKDTLGYSTGEFDHDKFWQWVRDMDAAGHTVFVSEYNAPDDFLCVWEKPSNVYMSKSDKGYTEKTERLWRIKK